MFQSYRRLVVPTIVALILAFGVSGCSGGGPQWVDEGADYTTTSVERLLDTADITGVSDRPTTEATKMRHDALSALRKQGDSASKVTDMLTSTFDPATRAVPVYVEKASLEGTSVVIVVEATGPKSGDLKMKRLWVLTDEGSVVLARSR